MENYKYKKEQKKLVKKIGSIFMMVILVTTCFGGMTPIVSEAASSINAKMDTAITGKLDKKDQQNLYKFKTTKNGYINLLLSANDIDAYNYGWNIDIYDANFKHLMEYDRAGMDFKSGRIEMGKNVTFYVKVSATEDYSDDTAPVGINYTLVAKQTQNSNWEKGNNNSYPKADKLTYKKKTYGTIWQHKDVDFYKYTTKTTGYTQFLFSVEEIPTVWGDGYWEVTFYDKNLNCIYYENYIKDIGFYSHKFNFKKGTVIYIKVEAQNKYSNDSAPTDAMYSIKPIEKSTSLWEIENNNRFNKATVLSTKGKMGTCLTSKDIDFYKYKAKSTGKKKIRFTLASDNDCGSGWKIEIYDSKKRRLAQYYYVTEDKIMRLKMKKGSTYYIKIYPSSSYGASGDDEYKLKIS